MIRIYLDWFCELLNKDVCKEYTAYSLMIDLEKCLQHLKSEILSNKIILGESKDDYLKLVVNELTNCNYPKNADLWYVEKWLKMYNVTIEDILNKDINDSKIYVFINNNYQNFDRGTEERDIASLIQNDFNNFFCKYFATIAIDFCSENKTKIIEEKTSENSKSFKKEYLEAFINEISNERDIYQSTFIQCYDFGIVSLTEQLKEEINENLLILPTEKANHYIELVKNKIYNSPYYQTNENSLNKWIEKYSLQSLNFPFLENKEVNYLITKSINYYLWDHEDRALMEDIQLDFFHYASMIEAKDIISFIEEKTNDVIKAPKLKKQEVTFDPIFKSKEAFEAFLFLINKLDISIDVIQKRGTQAKFNAIWSCPKSKKEIFKEFAELKEYVNYINNIYKTTYSSRTMSDGTKYHNLIKEWLI
jgi:hypothetical protein